MERTNASTAGRNEPSTQLSDALVLAVQRLNSLRIEQKGVKLAEMAQGIWKISQVEVLIGLPRRDIQRACYSGRGGAAILEPEDGSWGKRAYSCEDVAKLFVVKRLRDQGLSLPEVKERFDRFEEGRHDYSMIDDQISAMLADSDCLEAQIACGRALSIAVEDGLGSEALCSLVLSETLKAIACVSAEASGSDGLLDALVLLLRACAEIKVQDMAAFRACLLPFVDEGIDPASSDAQVGFRKVLRRELGADSSQNAHLLEAMLYVMDQPAMNPLMDIWIAPRAADYLRELIESAHAATETRKDNR